jgi:hypothetical protein
MSYLLERIRREWRRLRETGDRLTGGGLRSLSKRLVTGSVRRAVSQPFLRALSRTMLQPFPSVLARLNRLVIMPDAVGTRPTSKARRVITLC